MDEIYRKGSSWKRQRSIAVWGDLFLNFKRKKFKSITLTQYQIEGKDRLGSVSSGKILNQFKHMQQL